MSAEWASGGAVEWDSAGGGGSPRTGEVHVWHAVLGEAGGGAGDAVLLGPDERARAAAFAFARLRREWVWGRATLRRVLAGQLKLDDPGAVALVRGEDGKLSVGGSDLEFSLARSRGRLVVAVTRGRAVGVDLERTTRVREPLALAERFFTAGEARGLRALADPDVGFAALWACKEAYAKALGAGRWLPGEDFELGPGPVLVRTAGRDPREPGDWVLAQREIAPDCVCAVALAGPRLVLIEHDLPV